MTKKILALLLLLIAVLACNLPERPQQGQPSANTQMIVTPTPAIVFLGATPQPRDAARIVILSVVPDNQMNIREVTLSLPKQLTGARVFANGVEVVGVSGEDGTTYRMEGVSLAKTVTMTFEVEGARTAKCTIDADNLLLPSGDCSW